MEVDRCDDCCFKCLCDAFGYIFCCRKMKNGTRIKILWSWLIFIATCSCLLIGCVLYSSYNLMSSPSDMRQIKDHVDFLFCEKIRVTSPVFRFNGYISSGKLGYAKEREDFHQVTAINVDAEAFKIVPFYFLPSTTVNIQNQICDQVTVNVYVINGRENLRIWKENRYCDDCYLWQKTLDPSSDEMHSCSEWPAENTISLEVTGEGEFFVVYRNEDTVGAWVNLKVNINRTVYDIEQAHLHCINVNDCSFELSNPKDTAIIWVDETEDLSGKSDVDSTMTTECVPRIWAYLLIHGLPVLIIGITFTLILRKVYGVDESDGRRITERSPLIQSELPPSYSNVILSPPKYEDIVRGDELPSYAQAVATIYQHSEHTQQSLHVPVHHPNHRNARRTSRNRQAARTETVPEEYIERQCTAVQRSSCSCNRIYESPVPNSPSAFVPTNISINSSNDSILGCSPTLSSFGDVETSLPMSGESTHSSQFYLCSETSSREEFSDCNSHISPQESSVVGASSSSEAQTNDTLIEPTSSSSTCAPVYTIDLSAFKEESNH